MIRIKRVYEAPARADGKRLLVDRIWPRGIRKDSGVMDLWMKEVAPSTELREWFAHDPDRWDEFRVRYFRELDQAVESIARIRELEREHNVVTLLYSARDELHNQARALAEYLSDAKKA